MRVSFTDDGGNAESLTSAATAVVAAAPSSIPEDEEEEETTPLTAGAHDVPGSHDGSATFTFEVRFSEQIPLSYVTLRDHAFTVTGGEVTKARRLEPGNSAGKNVRWEISVTPDGNGAVTIVLPAHHGLRGGRGYLHRGRRDAVQPGWRSRCRGRAGRKAGRTANMGEIEPYIKTEPAGRRGRGRRLLLAAAAVLAPAEPQNTVTLVSNLALGAETTVVAGGSHPRYASSFNTGSADGYGLASVALLAAFR